MTTGSTRSKANPKPPTRPAGAGSGETPTPRRRLRIPLRTAFEVRRELARVYREARGGSLDVGDASRLGNLLLILARLIEESDLEARLTALERELSGGSTR